MQKQAQRSSAGAHRKTSVSHSTKGAAALLAVATGAAGSAAAAGAAVAHAQAPAEAPVAPSYELAADDAQIIIDSAPQILEIAEFKPVANLADQVTKAIQYAGERKAADEAARAPQAVKPAEGILTSGYGMRWGTLHAGIDIANSLGTPIVAVEDGTVIDAGPASGFGQWVRIQHEDGTITVYGHMETIDVSVGQQVTAGTKIAGMGSRGFSTGVHLHFEVHPGGGGAIDPVPWLAERGINV
ncbi:endopeptidase [Corynebacterium sp. 13CS0277]|uniref:M23 family metallopeptidase n=1 Tax=Corynebacterium sp. 13CS0277 TaxID=2071994 RepID=UPI000D044E35|nr:M23 family metallopeptidase [Corynebacterium sp. 13CS0277]PRQ11026.1 endopeptidase [Corynebacterium sp. 13CS0277]